MKVICVGSTSKDIFFPTEEGQILNTPEDLKCQQKYCFELGAKYHIDNRFESLGGCAANQAVGLSRLGIATTCYTAIGSDHIGKWIKEQFFQEGISEELIRIVDGCLSGLSAIIVDKKSADRIIFSNQEANEKLVIEADKLKKADLISVTDLSGDWKKVLDEVANVSREFGVKIVFNPRHINIKENSRKVAEMASQSEIFFLNKDEAIELLCNLGIQTNGDEAGILREIKNLGPKISVVTGGTNGAWAYDGQNIFFSQAVSVNAVDSTGAGDAFSSGFLAAYIKEKTLDQCLQWGILNGGSVVEHYGGTKGLLREDEMNGGAGRIGVQKI